MSAAENLNALADFFQRQGCYVVAKRFGYLAEHERAREFWGGREWPEADLARLQNRKPMTINRIRP